MYIKSYYIKTKLLVSSIIFITNKKIRDSLACAFHKMKFAKKPIAVKSLNWGLLLHN